ncbi:hypothetical protein ABB37_02395 [Leptomonas pyrrhocoris]|uniref:Uncharacterized protein n=1 Tax=Leptomonas pyrrhocoris TaxID=157538 RepID=A0A0N1J596_LEPPY|nr:hypothetical protein ABB37_02395 [Leptomonas pyrrhocoris]KPA84418.1 hypothetical protein ABB37_02395 [Leptomonas pyrrhocoris]|eukprot:XP_015662857.1 hypothetical protein ABB37_02395 [Leptomonas pyrrhocoris]
MKLVQREHERVRLEEEHRAREEAMDKVIENRGKELREEGAARDASAEESATLPTCVMTSVEVSPPSNLLSPKADATREAADASYEKMSRASSYSFASIATTRSGAVGPQPALPHLSKQHPPGTHRRGASPVADAGEFSTKSDAPVESMASNRMGGVNRSAPTTTTTGATSAAAALAGESRPQQQSQTAPPSSQVVPPPRGSIIASAPAVLEPKQPWHRCPTVVVYEIPLRCRRTTNEEGREVIDDADFPVRIHSKTLRVTDPETKLVSEFPHDELVIHRKNSTNVASQLLDKVRDVVIAGYTASVLSLDSKGLAKPTSAFDSAAWMAKQRLVLNLVASVEKMQTIYAKNGGLSSNNSSIEVCVSIALVKKVSAEKATEWKVTDPAMQQRTFEVIDLLKPEPAVAQLRMRTSMLSGSRLDGVQYKPVGNEAEFNTLLTGAQSSANVVLGRLADAAAVAPDNAALMAENDSVLEVLTCIVRHHKEGAVALADQIKEAPRDVFARGNAADVISSDDEDDDARVLDSFNAHNGPSNCSDTVVSCLTCIGARQNADVWGAALERKEEVAPLALFTTAFGGPAYTVIIASVDPTSREAAATLSMQVGMTIKLHRRPTNGSARRLIQSSKYQAGAAQKELDRPVRPSGSEQRELKTTIRKSAATLESLEKALADGG